jgi:Ca2+-binding EF-hand superfamily protein
VPLGSSKDPTVLANATGVQAMASPSGTLVLGFGDRRLEIDLALRYQPPNRVDFRRDALARFDAQDSDRNGVLDRSEIYRPPFAFVPLMRLADRDGDGKLSRKEYSDYLDLQFRLNVQTTFLLLDSRGRGLFDLLDADHDGRLSVREMRNAWARVTPWDQGKEFVTAAMLPEQYRLTLSHGRPVAQDTPFSPTQIQRGIPRRGPLWFRKMDRNGDGDVSPAEWLGTMEQFRALDLDGDGLIDAREAEIADRKLRRETKK